MIGVEYERTIRHLQFYVRVLGKSTNGDKLDLLVNSRLFFDISSLTEEFRLYIQLYDIHLTIRTKRGGTNVINEEAQL